MRLTRSAERSVEKNSVRSDTTRSGVRSIGASSTRMVRRGHAIGTDTDRPVATGGARAPPFSSIRAEGDANGQACRVDERATQD